MVAGIGQSSYSRRGQSGRDSHALALESIVKACEDANISPHDIDGFSSYSSECTDPARIAAALGIRELRYSGLYWGGGGGGVGGAFENAVSAIASNQAQCIVVFRSIAQPAGFRYGQGTSSESVEGELAHLAPYGVLTPPQFFSMKIQRFIELNGIGCAPMRNIAMASYAHAQSNPNAIMFKKPLSRDMYDNARHIAGPLRLYDCRQETDGAAAIVLIRADRSLYSMNRSCFLLSAVSGCDGRAGATIQNAEEYETANFKKVAKRLFQRAGLQPKDVDVIQSYENFTGGVMMSLIEHGLLSVDEVEEKLTLNNLLAGKGNLPLNTSGGHLAEAYVQGLNLCIEAVRQIRGTSPNQIPNVNVSLVTGGPLTAPVSSLIFCSEDVV